MSLTNLFSSWVESANQIQLALFVSAEGPALIVENGSCEFQARRIDVFIAC